jgi:hypothetical protein
MAWQAKTQGKETQRTLTGLGRRDADDIERKRK